MEQKRVFRAQRSSAIQTANAASKAIVALYLELKGRDNGSKNGSLFVNYCDAAQTPNVRHDTVASYFKALEDRGFIAVTKGQSPGFSEIGLTTHYQLIEATYESKLAS